MILLLAAILPALAMGNGDTTGVKLPPPRVQYRPNEASATTSPWIDANGWKILRAPGERFYYDVPGNGAALAAAEAFVYGANAVVHTDQAGTDAFQRMVEFLRTVPDADLPVMANFGIIDDGSKETGELMNLMSRHNLLYKIVTAPDPHLDLNIKLGTKEYPLEQASNPDFLSHKLRAQLGDEKRLSRVYGSETVIVRLLGDSEHARVHILNYASRPAPGLRVRLLGIYRQQTVRSFGKRDLKLEDVSVENGATEFTVPEINVYAVVDLTK
jgi:hypothetical protein